MDKIATDTILIKEGDNCPYLYKVINGSFAIYLNYKKDNEYLLGVVGKNKCFGELGFLTDEPSPYTYVANEESLVMGIDQNNFQAFITQNPKNVINIMSSMAKQIALLTHHIESLMGEITGSESKKEELTKQLREKIKQYQNFKF